MLNAITVDVEDYFHTEAMSAVAPKESWESMPCRVQAMTERLFELFAGHNVRGTFFFLGWVAERYPSLVHQAVKLGHEVACHSYWHRAVFRLTPQEFSEDTQRAKDVIEAAAGVAVKGYRAPSFSLTPGTEWATEILAKQGFDYDSSVNPIRHEFYSNADAPRFPYRTAQGALAELPIATTKMIGNNWPCGGGAYLRLFPQAYFRWALKRLNEHEQQPAMIYLHPWEIDADQPRLNANFKARLRQYTGLRRMAPNLTTLIQEFKFAPVREAFAEHLKPIATTAASEMSRISDGKTPSAKSKTAGA